MNDALDAVRCEEWNAARAARPRPEGKRGRPAKGELPPEEVRACFSQQLNLGFHD